MCAGCIGCMCYKYEHILLIFVQVERLTDLIMTSQNLMRKYAIKQLKLGGLGKPTAKVSARSCVSQRDIQRVFTFYQWVMAFYTKYQPYGERQDYSRRAVLVALGIVYYMRLNSEYREDYSKHLDEEVRLPWEINFSQVGSEYIRHCHFQLT